VTAANGLRHRDLNDLWQVVEHCWPIYLF